MVKIGKYEIRSPFANAQNVNKAGLTAQQTLAKHISTSRAHEDRSDGSAVIWAFVNSPMDSTASVRERIRRLEKRVMWLKILWNSFIINWVDVKSDPQMDAKAAAMREQFTWWDIHYYSMRRVDPEDVDTLEIEFSLCLVMYVGRIYDLSWPKELTRVQEAYFYQEMPSPFGGLGSGGNNGQLDPELKKIIEMASENYEVDNSGGEGQSGSDGQ